jgi:putative oxidoreductase
MHEALGLQVPLAFLAVAAEFVGGLGLIAGLLSRVAAARIAAIMPVAILLMLGGYGFFLNWFGERTFTRDGSPAGFT